MSKVLAPTADQEAEGISAEAPPASEETENALPEKYRGKTPEEIAEMHANAEKELGRIRNELGTMRGLVSDLSSLQRQAPEPQTVQEPEEVDLTGDEILSRPAESIRKVVQRELEPMRQASEREKAEAALRAETHRLEADFSDLQDTVTSDEFVQFANRTSSRQRDLEVAANGEGLAQVHAARRLLEDFQDFKAATTPPKEESPVEKAKKVATERRTTGAPISGKPQIFESEVIDLINSDPDKYRSPSFQRELNAAIAEGRFVKNT
jgi:hypothetical protein